MLEAQAWWASLQIWILCNVLVVERWVCTGSEERSDMKTWSWAVHRSVPFKKPHDLFSLSSVVHWFFPFHFTLSNFWYFYIWALSHGFYFSSPLWKSHLALSSLNPQASWKDIHHTSPCNLIIFVFISSPHIPLSTKPSPSVSCKYLRLLHLCALVWWHIAAAYSTLSTHAPHLRRVGFVFSLASCRFLLLFYCLLDHL